MAGFLHCQPLPLSGPWEFCEGGVTDPSLLGLVQRLRWRREERDGDDDMHRVDQGGGELDAPSPLLRGAAPDATTARVGSTLDPCVLLGEDVQKGARG